MQLEPQDIRRAQELWFNWGEWLMLIMDRQIKEYGEQLSLKDGEWSNAEQLVSYVAKKRALIDLKELLSKRYE